MCPHNTTQHNTPSKQTNIIRGRGADETFNQLSKMWAAANKDGTTVVVIPVLPTKYDSIEPRRQALNAKTRRAAAEALRQAGGGGGGGRAAPGVLLLDLEKSFDLKDGRVYDDGLHFTDYGYQQHLSGLVYDGLVRLLRL
jgi:lysophospholipase L1-like esterase